MSPYRHDPSKVTQDGIRPSAVIPLSMLAAVIVIVALLIVAAASRGTPEHSPAPAFLGTPPEPSRPVHEPRHDGSVPYPPAPAYVAGSEGSMSDLTTPKPGAPKWHGTATWYCSATSACPRGYGPSDLVAAIDRKDSPFRKGDRVTVRYHCGKGCERSVTVRIVDVCRCSGARVIDLTSGAFRRLAPLGLGVIPVTIEAADLALPETDR